MKTILGLILMIYPMVDIQAQWKSSGGKVSFSIKNAGLTVNGTLGNYNAKIDFNPNKPELAQMEGTVDVSSLETGIDMRNRHLKKEEYFDASKFPTINMKLIELEGSGKSLNAKFKLTIKGITKVVLIPVQFSENGKTATLRSTFTINRLDYKVGESSWTMADKVNVEIIANLII